MSEKTQEQWVQDKAEELCVDAGYPISMAELFIPNASKVFVDMMPEAGDRSMLQELPSASINDDIGLLEAAYNNLSERNQALSNELEEKDTKIAQVEKENEMLMAWQRAARREYPDLKKLIAAIAPTDETKMIEIVDPPKTWNPNE